MRWPADVPAYLADLERDRRAARRRAARSYRAALRGDLHTHSDWSDGGSPIEEMAMTAIELGHEYVVLTDHSPRLKVANGLSARPADASSSRWSTAVNEHLGGGASGCCTGIEVDILDDGALDQTEEMLGRLDVVVASVHSKLRMDTRPDDPADGRPPSATRAPTCSGHCTGRLVTRRPRHPAAERVRRRGGVRGLRRARRRGRDQLPARAAATRPTTSSALALEAGCLFSIDSDAHAPGQLDFLDYGARAGRSGSASRWTGSSTPGRWTRLLAWANG